MIHTVVAVTSCDININLQMYSVLIRGEQKVGDQVARGCEGKTLEAVGVLFSDTPPGNIFF